MYLSPFVWLCVCVCIQKWLFNYFLQRRPSYLISYIPYPGVHEKPSVFFPNYQRTLTYGTNKHSFSIECHSITVSVGLFPSFNSIFHTPPAALPVISSSAIEFHEILIHRLCIVYIQTDLDFFEPHHLRFRIRTTKDLF